MGWGLKGLEKAVSKAGKDIGAETKRFGGSVSKESKLITNGSAFKNAWKATIETVGVFDGQYAEENKDLKKKSDKYNKKQQQYKDAIDKVNNKFVIPEEIFQLAHKRDVREVEDKFEPELKALYNQLKAAQDKFNKDFHTINNALKNSKFESLLLWMPMVVGGLVSDTEDFLTKGDWAAGRRLLNISLEVIGVLITIILLIASLALDVATGGSTSILTVVLVTSLIAQVAILVIQLDSAYARGSMMNGVFSTLGFLLNDVLHMDDWAKQLDIYKLSDSQYYAELTGYVQAIAAITVAVTAIITVNCNDFEEVSASASANMPEGLSEYTTITSSMTYKEIALAYNAYSTTNNIIKQNEALEAMKKKAKEDTDKLHERIELRRKQKMMQSYRQVEDMLNPIDDILANYVISGFNTPTETFDPENIIAANFGYRYQGDDILSFTREYNTDYNSLAGGSKYINKILYKI